MKNLMIILISSSLSLLACSEQGERINQDKVNAAIKAQNAAYEKIGATESEYEVEAVSTSTQLGGMASKVNGANIIVVGDLGIWWNYELLAGKLVASRGGQVAVDLNNSGSWIAAGDKAVYVKNGTEKAIHYQSLNLGDKGSHFAVDINENGDWIAVGGDALYINAQRILGINLVGVANGVTAHIDEELNWVVMSGSRMWNGKFIPASENSSADSLQQ